jgi:hypothetical protein
VFWYIYLIVTGEGVKKMPTSRTVFYMSVFLVFASLLAYGCGKSETMDPGVEKLGRATGPVEALAAAAPAAAMPQPMAAQRPSGAVHTGEVLEIIQVPTYTYLLIKTAASGTLWTAIPSNDEVRVGQTVGVVESVVMKDFTSRSLGRTFSTIIFGILKDAQEGQPKPEKEPSTVKVTPSQVDPTKLPPGHPPITKQTQKQN